jgi:hypothetical protein
MLTNAGDSWPKGDTSIDAGERGIGAQNAVCPDSSHPVHGSSFVFHAHTDVGQHSWRNPTRREGATECCHLLPRRRDHGLDSLDEGGVGSPDGTWESPPPYSCPAVMEEGTPAVHATGKGRCFVLCFVASGVIWLSMRVGGLKVAPGGGLRRGAERGRCGAPDTGAALHAFRGTQGPVGGWGGGEGRGWRGSST